MDHCAKVRSHEQILTLSDTCSPGYLESISLMPLYTDHSYFSDVRRKYFPGFPKNIFRNWQKKTFCQQIKFYVQADKIEKVLFVEENQMAIYIFSEN